MKTRRESEPVFSKKDMLRFARWITNGKSTEARIASDFQTWSDGPEGKRYEWIKDSPRSPTEGSGKSEPSPIAVESAERNDRNALAVDHRCPECKGDHFLPADEGAGITTIKVKCTECGQKFHILLWRRQIIYVQRIS